MARSINKIQSRIMEQASIFKRHDDVSESKLESIINTKKVAKIKAMIFILMTTILI